MNDLDDRVLVLAPRGRDAAVIGSILARDGLSFQVCPGFDDLVAAVALGAGAVVVTEEALIGRDLSVLVDRLDRQEPWSDLPFILLMAQRAGARPRVAQAVFADLANVVLLERPINAETLQRGAASALRARRRQYGARDHLRERRAAAERLEIAMLAGRLGAWTFDASTGLMTASDQCRADFGRGPMEALNHADLLAALHVEDRERSADTCRRALAAGSDFGLECRIHWPNGELRWIEVRGRATVDDAGAVTGLTGVSQDITARHQASLAIAEGRRALEQLNQTLETRIAARTRDLAAANLRLISEIADKERMQSVLVQSQKMEAVGQLTGGVAHDFNNLLTIIRSSIDFLRRPDMPEHRRLRYVDAISQTVDRAAKLTRQLLAFARRQALTPSVFDVAAQVETVVDLVRPIVGARVEVVTTLCPTPCFVKADASQFETALINLAVNARDAMDGEGRLSFTVEPVTDLPAVRGHAGATGAFVAVSVTDTGCGIAPGHLANIFEPFFTTKALGKGTGLGLSQVFGFAKQSGGEVGVETGLGAGSTFRLYLPRVSREALSPEARMEDAGAAPSPGHGLRILVVEDNDAVGQFAVEMLEDLGNVPVRAANADEALRVLSTTCEHFDAVFSDVVMPGMNGLDLARLIRGRYPELPIILTSGYSNVLVQEGSHGFPLLHKPYSVNSLADLLYRVVPARADPGPSARP